MQTPSWGENEGYVWFNAAMGISSSVLLGAIVTIQARHTWYDLVPAKEVDRKSVAHRRNKPERTTSYKRIVYTTLLSMFCFLGSTFCWSMTGWAAQSALTCQIAFMCSAWLLGTAKLTMYATFFMRLHQCYNEQRHLKWYTRTRLCIIFGVGGAALVFTSVMWTVFMGEQTEPELINVGVELIKRTNQPDTFPYVCEVYPGYLALGVHTIVDMALASLNLWLFRKPLKNASEGIEANYRDDKARADKLNVKVLAVQKRTRVLVYTAIISSFTYLFLGGVTGLWFLRFIDDVVNCVSMAFMQGAYYDDHTNKCYSYRKLCFVCAKCCDRQGHSMRYESTRKKYESGVSHPTGVSGPAPSVDTLNAHAHIPAVKPSEQRTTILMTVPTQETEVSDALPVMGTDVSDYNGADGATEVSPMATTPAVDHNEI